VICVTVKGVVHRSDHVLGATLGAGAAIVTANLFIDRHATALPPRSIVWIVSGTLHLRPLVRIGS
jgi:hypothetical protein